MTRKLLRRKIGIICFIVMIFVGLAYLASVSSQRAQVETEWNYWLNCYQADQQRYEALVQSNASQEEKNREKEEQIRGIWKAVSDWEEVSYEEAVQVGAGSEYVKYVLAEMLDDLASTLASTSSNSTKIQQCQEFEKEVKSTIGEEGFGHIAIEYAEYLIGVFRERK